MLVQVCPCLYRGLYRSLYSIEGSMPALADIVHTHKVICMDTSEHQQVQYLTGRLHSIAKNGCCVISPSIKTLQRSLHEAQQFASFTRL